MTLPRLQPPFERCTAGKGLLKVILSPPPDSLTFSPVDVSPSRVHLVDHFHRFRCENGAAHSPIGCAFAENGLVTFLSFHKSQLF